jgi:outer membrane receptor for ferrienterochelin and colicins
VFLFSNFYSLLKQKIMFKKIQIILIFILLPVTIFSQQIQGVVYELNENGSKSPLPGVNVYLSDKSSGTSTDKKGMFTLDIGKKTDMPLVFSFVGYKPDTVLVSNINEILEIVLNLGRTLQEITISERGSGAHILRMEPILVQRITTGELQRAACCNLAESFETNASVDVQYNDAVSGAKQIQLLGLSGIYSQILFENMPYLRGLGIPYGLEYLPGSWLESIYISKGTSSVLNGYESITGQINAELKKPESDESTFINLYSDHQPRFEANINQRIVLDHDFQTMIFGHYQNSTAIIDHNKDGFLDVPLIHQLHLANHWNYHNDEKGFEARWGIRGLTEERKGGQVGYFKNNDSQQAYYGSEINTKRIDAFTKTGFLFKNARNMNIGFINSFSIHDMESFFGQKTYSGKQYGYYSNLIFNTELHTPEHTLHAGASLMYDEYNELLNDSIYNTIESVPGFFTQYTYLIPERLTLIAGVRIDRHSLHGLLLTPRVHLRYAFNEYIILRASAGKGYRSPRIIAENIQILASARQILFEETKLMEEAYNMGTNLTFNYKLFGKDISLTTEYYYTHFTNQAIIDYEKDMNAIRIYNLDGTSFASHAQIELSYVPFKNTEIRTAVRYNDVKTTYNGKLQDKYLVNNWKYLLTSSYVTPNSKWQFDATWLLNGKSRLPELTFNPKEYRLPKYSPAFSIVNLQITRSHKRWDFYTGVENLLNFTQKNPIIAADNPFGPYFDSSMIWGPIMGRKIYVGLRFKIDKPIQHD